MKNAVNLVSTINVDLFNWEINAVWWIRKLDFYFQMGMHGTYRAVEVQETLAKVTQQVTSSFLLLFLLSQSRKEKKWITLGTIQSNDWA